MFKRYKKKIEQYCEDLGIEIPVGFHRHGAGRYVAIDLDRNPPCLVAASWATEQDAAKFLGTAAAAQNVRLLDFEERRLLTFNDQHHFVRGEPF